MSVIKISKENFQNEVLNSDKTVLLDFYADWCGPCLVVGPIVSEIAEERSDVKVGKINVDEQPGLALRYQVMSIPMLVTMNLGMFAGKSVGVISEAEVLELLKKASALRDQKIES